MDAVLDRLSVREMADAAVVSLERLQKAFERAHRDLETGAPGDIVFAIVRRWGFTSPGVAFGDGYRGPLSRAAVRHAEAGTRRAERKVRQSSIVQWVGLIRYPC